MTAEREALVEARRVLTIQRNELLVRGYSRHDDEVADIDEVIAKIDQALANPATIRDTDEDAEVAHEVVEHLRRCGAHHLPIDNGKAIWAACFIERRLASSPAEPREASGYCPYCMTADPVSRA